MRVAGRGVFPAPLTMFTASGELGEPATAAHLERLVEQGAHGVVVAGTSGEFIALSDAERERILEVAVEAVAGRVPLIAGTGYFATVHTSTTAR